MTRSIPVEPINHFHNPTSISLASNQTIPATARYIVRVTPTNTGFTLVGRAGMSNLIQNEGSFAMEVTPVGGTGDITLSPGNEIRLTWDSLQSHHEVQEPAASSGSITIDDTVTTGSTHAVKSSGIASYVHEQFGGVVVRATGVSATDTAALTAAAATSSKKIIIDDRTAPLTLSGGGFVYLHDKLVVPMSGQFGINLSNSTVLQFGEYYSPVSQTTNWQSFTLSADKCVVTSAGLTGVAVGDVLIFGSTDPITDIAPHFSLGTQLPGETAVVKVVSGSTYTLDTQLVDTYTTNAKVAVLSRTSATGSVQKLSVDCGMIGANFEGSDQSTNAVLFYSCLRPRIYDTLLQKCGQIVFSVCNKPIVSGLDITHQKTANADYGITATWCDEGDFANIRAGSCRHAFTTGGFGTGITRYGTNRRNVVRDSQSIPDGKDASGNTNIAWNTHAEGYGTTFKNIRTVLTGPSTISPSAGPSMIAFSDRARRTEYQNCRVVGNKLSLHRGWVLSGSDTSLHDCEMNGGWAGVLAETTDVQNSSAVVLPANRIKVYGGVFENFRNEAMIFNGGTGHRVIGATILTCGASSSGLWGSVRAGIAFADTDTLGLSDVAVEECYIPKQDNLYSVGVDALTDADMVLRGNRFEGYGNASIGLNRSLSNVPQLEAAWGNQQQGRARYLYCEDTAHGYTTGTHLYRPIDIDMNILDDTATLVPLAGILVDVIDANWMVLAQPGQDLLLPVAMLSGSYSISADGRKLYWDASAAKFAPTKPGDSHATVPVLLQVFSLTATHLRCRVASI